MSQKALVLLLLALKGSNDMVEKRIVIDLDRCIGCQACEVACRVEHCGFRNLERAQFYDAAIPSHCRHCEDASCVSACPFEALTRTDEGIVRRNAFRCVGCKSCAIACPFGAIDMDIINYTVSKCDLNEERVLAGKTPACVATCPAGALKFEPIEEAVEKNLLGARVIGKRGVRR